MCVISGRARALVKWAVLCTPEGIKLSYEKELISPNEIDVPRHARRDRCAHAATSHAYVAASFISKCKHDDRLRP